MYPLVIIDREIFDKVSDELHEQKVLEWTIRPTNLSYPYIVVWKTLPNGDPKGWLVIE